MIWKNLDKIHLFFHISLDSSSLLENSASICYLSSLSFMKHDDYIVSSNQFSGKFLMEITKPFTDQTNKYGFNNFFQIIE